MGHRGALYVYREESFRTLRWLVDREGRILDFVSLRYAAPSRSRRFLRSDRPRHAAISSMREWPSSVVSQVAR